jgi:hypothetical protein
VGTHDDGFVSSAELAGLVNARTAGPPPELDGVRLNCRHGYRAPFKILDIEPRYGNLTRTYAAQVHIAVIENRLADPQYRGARRHSRGRLRTVMRARFADLRMLS